jgi:hypothetical protein
MAPEDPFHPTVLLNAHFRAAPTTTNGRMTASFTPSNVNLGNTLSAAFLPTSSSSSSSSSADATAYVAFRRAGTGSSRPTAVGWGSFAPLSPDQRGRVSSKKGKERAFEDDEGEDAARPSFSSGAFVPSSVPLWSGNSPIQQLQLSPLSLSTAETSSAALLAIRSFTSFTLLRLSLSSPFDPGTPPSIVSSFSYSGRDFGKQSVADFALAPGGGGGGLVVTTSGSLFGWGLGGAGRRAWEEGRRPEMFRLRKGREKASGGDYSGFARVEYGGARGGGLGAVVAMEDEVLLYDLRVRSSLCFPLIRPLLTRISSLPVPESLSHPPLRPFTLLSSTLRHLLPLAHHLPPVTLTPLSLLPLSHPNRSSHDLHNPRPPHPRRAYARSRSPPASARPGWSGREGGGSDAFDNGDSVGGRGGGTAEGCDDLEIAWANRRLHNEEWGDGSAAERPRALLDPLPCTFHHPFLPFLQTPLHPLRTHFPSPSLSRSSSFGRLQETRSNGRRLLRLGL